VSRQQRFDRITGEESVASIEAGKRADGRAWESAIGVTVTYHDKPVVAYVTFRFDAYGNEVAEAFLTTEWPQDESRWHVKQKAIAEAIRIRDEIQRRAWEEDDVDRAIARLKAAGRLVEVDGKWVLLTPGA
jgi:hypothetical protein